MAGQKKTKSSNVLRKLLANRQAMVAEAAKLKSRTHTLRGRIADLERKLIDAGYEFGQGSYW